MALYTYRQMPPTGPDNITGPLIRPAGARSLFWVPSDPMKTIHFESAAHYHRLDFDARLKLKWIDTRMDTLIYRAVYKYSLFPSLSVSLSIALFFHSRSSFLTRYMGEGGERYVPTCVTAVLRNTRERERERERLPGYNLYDWPSLHRDPSFAIMRKRCFANF